MRAFWPPREAAQADYEAIRAAVIANAVASTPAAVRFARGGLPALIARPLSVPGFVGLIVGAQRPAWTPHTDPRLEALAASYALVLGITQEDESEEAAR